MKTAQEYLNLILSKPLLDVKELESAMKEYTRLVARATLESAAENATCSDASWNAMPKYTVDYSSIIDTEILTP